MFKFKLKLGAYCYWCKQWHPEVLWLCQSCYRNLPWLTEHTCRRCASPLKQASEVCGQCLDWPPITTSAIFRFEHPINQWVYQVKYGRQWWLAKALSQLMADYAILQQRHLLWVPSTHAAIAKRGFNFAWMLAEPLSNKYQLTNSQPFKANPKISPQASLTKKQRQSASSKRFTLQGNLTSKKILLIDDVMTTGSTILALTHLLNKQGITDIQVLVLARALI